MRRALGNHLIRLAYLICPALKAELQHAVEILCRQAAEATTEQAIRLGAEHAVQQLLEHQQRAARIAARQ